MLRKIRIVLAAIFFFFITLLFLDFTGTVQAWMGWMAKIQFIPAVLAANVAVIIALIVLTLVFGRVYCSIICPMGIMQDIISWSHGRTKKKNRFRFSWSPEKKVLRISVLAIFIMLMLLGLNSIAALIAPYSAFGRIAGSILAPIYAMGNNIMAYLAERLDSYAFYTTEVWMKSLPALAVAILTLLLVGYLAWKGGRTYCNTICPVGTVLGFVSRFSFFRIAIDTDKCRNCGLCGKQCKASCINMAEHKVDLGRCVVCMDCIGTCHEGAVKYMFCPPWKAGRTGGNNGVHEMKDNAGKAMERQSGGAKGSMDGKGRRMFITSSALMLGTGALKAQEIKTDGGLATVIKKKAPERKTPLTPAGSMGHAHFYRHCTACQLCVSECPNNVLRPSSSLEHLMQPEMSYERGYCRPECTRCSQVCPAGAFHPVTPEEKSSIQIGRATVDLELCVVNKDKVSCGNCARHCPVGAIRLVRIDPDDKDSLRIPAVNPERCIGCGACEYLCPARPLSAIRVEGNMVHHEI
ncbi:MAG: 4Fe-4S dicluster domain-containing protein [Bacteroidales bacterium]|nr:4Fe-4S dicluster domain-containing protein [Bacteroidales bacterium]